TRPQPPCRLTSLRNALSVMPAIGAIAKGDGRFTRPMRIILSMRRVLLWLPPLLYMAVIFYLSSQPAPLPALTAHVWDKALHFTEYTVLCALLCRALHGEGLATLRVALLGLLLTSAY